MRNQKLAQRKRKKALIRRNDYIRRRNINKNIPIEIDFERIPVYKSVINDTELAGYAGNKKLIRKVKRTQVFDKQGKPELEHIGYKYKIIKRKRPVHCSYNKAGQKEIYKHRKDEHNRAIPMIAYPLRSGYKRMNSKEKISK